MWISENFILTAQEFPPIVPGQPSRKRSQSCLAEYAMDLRFFVKMAPGNLPAGTDQALKALYSLEKNIALGLEKAGSKKLFEKL